MGAYEYHSVTTAQLSEVAVSRPQEFILYPTYPNPFNPKATISFDLSARNAKLILPVYNSKGQLIKSLLDNEMEAGSHSIIWDATNDRGQSVSSGLYFYKMEMDKFSNTKSMILLK